MLKINLGSIVLMDLIITGICLSVMIQLWNRQRNKFPGLTYWVYFLLFQFIGIALIAMRGIAPDWASVVLSNSLVVCGFLLLQFGLNRFLGKSDNFFLNLLLAVYLAAFTFIHYYFSLVQNDLPLRIYNSAAGLFIGSSLCARVLFSSENAQLRRIARNAAISCGIFAATALARFFGNYFFPVRGSHFLEAGGFDGIAVGLMVGALAYMTFHLVMMVGTRLFFEVKENEQALQDSELRWVTTLESIGEGVITTDNAGKVIFMNAIAESMTGWKHSEASGNPITEVSRIVNELTDQTSENPVTRVLQEGAIVCHGSHAVLVKKDGAEIPVEYSCAPIRNMDAAHQGVIIVFRDITERMHLEKEKAKLDARRRQIQKAESLGRMAGAIAHQYNNLMGAVIGHLELAKNRLPMGSAIGENLTEAMNSAQRAAEISALMLTYLGLMPDKKESLNLSDVCRHCLEILRAALPRQLNLKTHIASPGPMIHGNRSQIQQALIRLIDNAREAMDPTPGTIHLTVKTVSARDIPEFHRNPPNWQPTEPHYACIEVADGGCGIADADLEKLFDPFFTRKFIGRGLGLPVVLGIIRTHRGVVTVESQMGQGSSFRIFLPFSSPETRKVPEKSAIIQKEIESGTVLLVEDDPSVRRMTQLMLEALGFRVYNANNGLEAVEVLSQHQADIHCVMCDLTIRDMDGWETLASLRKVVPKIPVILTSGNETSLARTGDRSEWPDAFLGKPYQSKEVYRTILEALQRGKKAMT